MSDTKQNAAAASPTRLVMRELPCVSAQFWLTRRNVHRQVIALGYPQRDKTLTQEGQAFCHLGKGAPPLYQLCPATLLCQPSGAHNKPCQGTYKDHRGHLEVCDGLPCGLRNGTISEGQRSC